MNSFIIGDVDFGIGDYDFSIEDNVLNLEIYADEDRFDALCEDEDFEYGWALYAPKIYFTDVPFEHKEIEINDDMLSEYDIALYMMEHYDFFGKVMISEEGICIEGEVDFIEDVKKV